MATRLNGKYSGNQEDDHQMPRTYPTSIRLPRQLIWTSRTQSESSRDEGITVDLSVSGHLTISDGLSMQSSGGTQVELLYSQKVLESIFTSFPTLPSQKVYRPFLPE